MAKTVMAYILIVVELGHTDSVLKNLKTIDEATRIAVTTGEYDIVVLVEPMQDFINVLRKIPRDNLP